MYGPLAHVLIGATYRFTGPNVYSGRLLSLTASLVTISLLAWICAGSKISFSLLVSWVLLFGINGRAINYFVESRPDMLAILFALVALILLYKGRTAFGSLFLIVAFLFKQTAVVFSLIPLVAYFFENRRVVAQKALQVALPAVSLLMFVIAIRLLWPSAYNYMVIVPGQYPIPFKSLVQNSIDLLATVPLFFIALASWIRSKRNEDRVGLWLLASIVITVPTCIVFASKVGGTYNSFLPVFFAMMGFVCLEIRRMPIQLNALIALLAVVTLFAHIGSALRTATNPHGDENYDLAIRSARDLSGVVVCPEDPFMLVLAKGETTTSAFLEREDIGWSRGIPPRTRNELASAGYVIQVKNTPYRPVTDSVLFSQGFSVKERIGDSYVVWERR